MISQQLVPHGAIIFFDLESCPDGWSALNSEGAFIRDVAGYAGDRGVVQEGGVPNIKGNGPRFAKEIFHQRSKYAEKPLIGPYIYAENGDVETGGENGDGGNSGTQGWNFDASHASTVYKDNLNEVRPKNIAYLACRKN